MAVSTPPLAPGGHHNLCRSIIPHDSVELRCLTRSDLPAFRVLRLQALRRHPEAFVPSYEEECDANPQALPAHLRDGWIHEGSFILGAFQGTTLVGALGVHRPIRRKQRHKAIVWILYTDQAVRGQGIGRRLLDTSIEECRGTQGLELLQLSVSAESLSARRLYELVDFQPYGREPSAIKLDDRSIDAELLTLRLHGADGS